MLKGSFYDKIIRLIQTQKQKMQNLSSNSSAETSSFKKITNMSVKLCLHAFVLFWLGTMVLIIGGFLALQPFSEQIIAHAARPANCQNIEVHKNGVPTGPTVGTCQSSENPCPPLPLVPDPPQDEGHMLFNATEWVAELPQNPMACISYDPNISNDMKVSGWVWNDNLGWTSFSCTDEDNDGDLENIDFNCGSVEYQTSIDPVTGEFSGFAWNENVGWIEFDGTSNVTVETDLNGNPGRMTGFAWNNSVGWIKFEPTQFDYVSAMLGGNINIADVKWECKSRDYETGQRVSSNTSFPADGESGCDLHIRLEDVNGDPIDDMVAPTITANFNGWENTIVYADQFNLTGQGETLKGLGRVNGDYTNFTYQNSSETWVSNDPITSIAPTTGLNQINYNIDINASAGPLEGNYNFSGSLNAEPMIRTENMLSRSRSSINQDGDPFLKSEVGFPTEVLWETTRAAGLSSRVVPGLSSVVFDFKVTTTLGSPFFFVFDDEEPFEEITDDEINSVIIDFNDFLNVETLRNHKEDSINVYAVVDETQENTDVNTIPTGIFTTYVNYKAGNGLRIIYPSAELISGEVDNPEAEIKGIVTSTSGSAAVQEYNNIIADVLNTRNILYKNILQKTDKDIINREINQGEDALLNLENDLLSTSGGANLSAHLTQIGNHNLYTFVAAEGQNTPPLITIGLNSGENCNFTNDTTIAGIGVDIVVACNLIPNPATPEKKLSIVNFSDPFYSPNNYPFGGRVYISNLVTDIHANIFARTVFTYRHGPHDPFNQPLQQFNGDPLPGPLQTIRNALDSLGVPIINPADREDLRRQLFIKGTIVSEENTLGGAYEDPLIAQNGLPADSNKFQARRKVYTQERSFLEDSTERQVNKEYSSQFDINYLRYLGFSYFPTGQIDEQSDTPSPITGHQGPLSIDTISEEVYAPVIIFFEPPQDNHPIFSDNLSETIQSIN